MRLFLSCITHIMSKERHPAMRLRIRELREEKKLSQTEMSKKMGVSQQTYSRYETHSSEIPLEKVVWLADFFEVSIDYLLGVSNNRGRN